MQKTWKTLAISAVAVLTACSGYGEEANHEDHEALRHLRDTFQEAAAQNRMDLMKPYLATNFSIVTFTDREFLDFDAFNTQWQKTRQGMLGDGGSFAVKLNPEYSVLLGDIALCRGNSSNTIVTAKGETYEFGAHWSVVCQKVDGQWKILRGHNSLNPFQNPMLEHGVKKIVLQAASMAFLIGALLGGVVVWIARRKKTS